MVDEERVVRLLGRLRADIAFLRRYAGRPVDELLADEEALSAVKYRFVTAIEGTVRVAHHLAAAEGWTPPETNAGALRELGRRGVLTLETARRLASAAGFRNVLVHQYAEVDDTIVVHALADLADLEDYVTQVAAWLRAGGGRQA